MTNEILCTIDFTESSTQALKWAIELARELNSKLTILYSFRLFKQHERGTALKQRMEEEARKKFTVLENELLKNAGIAYQFKTEVGFVDARIEEHTRTNKVGFLVMADEMRKGISDSFDALLAAVHVPLIIVPRI